MGDGYHNGGFGLTEVNGQVLRFVNHRFQHDARDQLDAILGLLRDQPLQNLFLLVQQP